MQIPFDAVGAWEIETFMTGAYRLVVPEDGRATVVELADADSVTEGAPIELLAWGHFDDVVGLGRGIIVGDCMLLVTNGQRRPGDYLTRITGRVVHILEDHQPDK